MLDIGFWELFLIAVIALVVLGPERMPAAVRSLGKTIGHWRRVAGRLHRDFMSEIDASELKEIKEAVSSAKEIKSELLTSANTIKDSVNKEVNDATEGAQALANDFSEADLTDDTEGGKLATKKKEPVAAKSKSTKVSSKTKAKSTTGTTKAKSTANKVAKTTAKTKSARKAKEN